jgi:hypothetical protein
MPDIPRDQSLIPSVLDRLIDADPAASRDPAWSRGHLLRDVLHAVRATWRTS